MKKWLCLLLAMLMLFSVGCGKKKASKKDDASSTTTTKGDFIKDDAIAAAEAYWNVKSGTIDPETGNRISVVITQFPSENNPYYRAVLRHMAEEGDNNQDPQQEEIIGATITQIDVVLVHSVTGEVIPESEK